MKNPNGPSIEEIEAMQDELQDRQNTVARGKQDGWLTESDTIALYAVIEAFKERGKTLPDLREALENANILCRLAFAVAKRKGSETNWKDFSARLQKGLEFQHRTMHPERYKADGTPLKPHEPPQSPAAPVPAK